GPADFILSYLQYCHSQDSMCALCSLIWLCFLFPLSSGMWSVQALEMIVGKIPFLQAVNGSTVMLPCTYASCIGIQDLYFNWQFNDNGTMQKVCESLIVNEGVEPHVEIFRERVEFVGKNRNNNVSILLWNITFEDGGLYTCFGRNPKEKGRNHSAIFKLIVVDELRVVDNTLTIMIASAVGGAIAALMGFMLLKNFTIFVLSKIEEKNKECLVTSSGIDNTENGLSGSKADSKPTPKKK
uniref:Sodium channel, voltage-gated, type IV, beta b n=1 Tax=Cyclopterus lumpus TaxID=8103 RepID=A0A8C3AEF8_CYCLU